MTMRKNKKYVLGIFMAAAMMCGVSGCGGADNDAGRTESAVGAKQTEVSAASSGEDLDKIEPSADDDNWYVEKNLYKDGEGHKLEVFFNDDGMLEFAIDGLSTYFTSASEFQTENNWRIYTCDDGTMIVYYPGDTAHVEISDGDNVTLYEQSAE